MNRAKKPCGYIEFLRQVWYANKRLFTFETEMGTMAKPRVAVFFGGMSSEHDVSLQSAASVIRNIPQDKYEVICVGITKKGRWLYYPGSPDRIASGEWRKDPDCCRAILSPDPTQRGLLKLMEELYAAAGDA